MTKLHIRSEVAYNTIRRIFQDPYAEITTTTLGRLAEALEVSALELIEDEPRAMADEITQMAEVVNIVEVVPLDEHIMPPEV